MHDTKNRTSDRKNGTGVHGAIPESKYWTQRVVPRSQEREGNLGDLLTLWEEKFEMDMATLVEEATADGYEPKFEGWDYGKVHHRAAHHASCRISFISTDRKTGLYATYDFFPFLDGKVIVVSPNDAENPARQLLDPILSGVGYKLEPLRR